MTCIAGDEHQLGTDGDTITLCFGPGSVLGSQSTAPHVVSQSENASAYSISSEQQSHQKLEEHEKSLRGMGLFRKAELEEPTNKSYAIAQCQNAFSSFDNFSADLRNYQQERRTQYLAQKVSKLQRECQDLEARLHHSENQCLLVESELSFERKERAAVENSLLEEMEQNKEFLKTRLNSEEAASEEANNGRCGLAWQLKQESEMEQLKEAAANLWQQMENLTETIAKENAKRKRSLTAKKSQKRRKAAPVESVNPTTNWACAIM